MVASDQDGRGPANSGAGASFSFEITEVGTRSGFPLLAMGACPGTRDRTFRPELLVVDAEEIARWGPAAVLSLIKPGDVQGLDLETLSFEVRRHGIGFLHLPLGPDEMPDEAFERRWEELRPRLVAALGHKRRLFVACPDGRGRSGIVTARLLIEAGADAADAIAAVQKASPGSLGTREHEESVRAYARRR